jgi:hypothetical protein
MMVKFMCAPTMRSSMEYTQIEFRAEFTIKEGKIEEYEKLVKDMSRAVEANEPDIINYEFNSWERIYYRFQHEM